jgi:hypothetical protein
VDDPGGAVVGPGVTVEGVDQIEVVGDDTVIAGLTLSRFTDPAGALVASGSAVVVEDVAIQDSAAGLRVDGADAVVSGVRLLRNGDPQADLRAPATLSGDVADGEGVGVRISASGVRLTLATIHGNGDAGVFVAKDSDDVAILDSTIAGNDGSGVEAEIDVDRLDIRNVIVAYNEGWGLADSPNGSSYGSPAYTLWFGNAQGTCKHCAMGQGCLEGVDPQLVDWSGGDFTPLPGSPAIDAGTGTTGVDRNGPLADDWLGAAPDLGAVEAR